MKKRFRVRWLVNLALLIFIGALIAIATLDRPAPVEPITYLGDYLPENITEIQILRTGKKHIHFKLINDDWHMVSPYQARAEDSLIKQILSVSNLEVSTIIDDTSINKEGFGLQPPLVTIQFNQQLLNFGDSYAINKRRYIELDDKIMLVPDQHVSQFKAGSVSYIDRHLIPGGSQIRNININGARVDPGKPEDIFTQWLDAKASWISLAADASKKQGIMLQIDLADGQSIHYLAEKRESDFVLTKPQQILEYHLPVNVATSLGIGPSDPVVDVDSASDPQQTDR